MDNNGMLLKMEIMYQQITTTKNNAERARLGNAMKEMYDTCPAVKENWIYHRSYRLWSTRFEKRPACKSLKKKENALQPYDDNIDYRNTPNFCGVYLLGDIRWDDVAMMKIFWVKVGLGMDIKCRLNNYDTYNPMVNRLDYKKVRKGKVSEVEKEYQRKLKSVALNRCAHNNEWFVVDEQTYYALKEQGFAFFDKI